MYHSVLFVDWLNDVLACFFSPGRQFYHQMLVSRLDAYWSEVRGEGGDASNTGGAGGALLSQAHLDAVSHLRVGSSRYVHLEQARGRGLALLYTLPVRSPCCLAAMLPCCHAAMLPCSIWCSWMATC